MLVILDNIIEHLEGVRADNICLKSQDALKVVNKLYPICTDFERAFISLIFVLATGVGKTRLMGHL